MSPRAAAWAARFKRAMPIVTVAVFGAALWMLGRELAAHRIDEIMAYLGRLPPLVLVGAVAMTVASYATLVCYDLSALHYVRRRLPLRDVAIASFVSYAFSNTIGFAAVTGGSVRYRLYSAAGLNGFEIAAVVVFCTLTFGIGALAISGLVLLLEPHLVTGVLPLQPGIVRSIGSALLALLLAYFIFISLKPERLRIRQWRVQLPTLGLSLAQVAIATVDMMFAAAALWLLMPAGTDMDYGRFLGIYVVATTLGILSHVPGGLGVFETVMLLMVPAPAGQMFGALLAFRVVYYLLPLGGAALLLAFTEIAERQHRLLRTAALLGNTVSRVAPHILAAATFLGGALLLFSGAVPELTPRVALVRSIVPEPLLELGNLIGGIAGIGMLLLSHSLLRRLQTAWWLTLLLVAAGIVSAVLKGFDYDEAGVLLVIFVALLPARPLFYRHAPLLGDRFGPAWLTAIAITLAAAGWLGFFSYKHVTFTGDLWLQFSLDASAPRVLRAALAVAVTAVTFGLAVLLTPAPPRPILPGPAELAEAARIIRRSPVAAANLALLGDKHLLFDDAGDAFLMYGVRGRSWVALGDPVGPAAIGAELVWRFQELSHRHDGLALFYDVGPAGLPLYLDLGLTPLKLGEEAWLDLPGFQLAGGTRDALAQACRRARREGAAFELLPAGAAEPALAELEALSDAWLAERRHGRERGFALGAFAPGYLRGCPIAVVRQAGRIVAFANLLTGADRAEVALDLMRSLPGTPPVLLDLLVVDSVAWARDQGYARFNLGLAPPAGLEGRPLGPLWSRAGAEIFNRGGPFDDFRRLRQYKARFQPQWRPKYLCAPGGLALPRVLADAAQLIAGEGRSPA
ncbi:MAG: bifunctional lysylphosphatidylglycerol flippase/synthetase MprF [Dongiaceae bacterium]